MIAFRLPFLPARESVRYISTSSGWRKWFRWTRVLFRPYRAAYFVVNEAWKWPVGRDEVGAQWAARRFEERNWNIARHRAWEAAVQAYPHGTIGGPLVIP